MSAEHGKDGIQDIQTALKIAGEKLGVRFNARDAQRSINRVLHAGEVRGVFYPYDREKALKSILQKPDDSHKGDVFLLFWNPYWRSRAGDRYNNMQAMPMGIQLGTATGETTQIAEKEAICAKVIDVGHVNENSNEVVFEDEKQKPKDGVLYDFNHVLIYLKRG